MSLMNRKKHQTAIASRISYPFEWLEMVSGTSLVCFCFFVFFPFANFDCQLSSTVKNPWIMLSGKANLELWLYLPLYSSTAVVSQEWTNTCKFENHVRVISCSYSLKCVQCIVVIGFEGTYSTPGAGARSRCSKASFYNIESDGSSCSCPSSSTCPSRENVRGGSSCPEADHGAPPSSISSQDLCKSDHQFLH